MDEQKFMTSVSTIPNESRLLNKAMISTSASLQNIISPYQETLPLKFPKKTIRRQTKANMLTQTMYIFSSSQTEP